MSILSVYAFVAKWHRINFTFLDLSVKNKEFLCICLQLNLQLHVRTHMYACMRMHTHAHPHTYTTKICMYVYIHPHQVSISYCQSDWISILINHFCSNWSILISITISSCCSDHRWVAVYRFDSDEQFGCCRSLLFTHFFSLKKRAN